MRVFKKKVDTFVPGILKCFHMIQKTLGILNLMTMDIETGDNLPISQKHYNLSLKHTVWVQKELETLEKAEIIF